MPIAVEEVPLAVVAKPIAVEASPLAVVPEPIAVEESPLAVVPEPIAVEYLPNAVVNEPIAVEDSPFAVVPEPIAVETAPLAVVVTPVAVEATPTFASSQLVRETATNPARNAALAGYHIIREPAPVAGMFPGGLVNAANAALTAAFVATMPPSASTLKSSVALSVLAAL